MDKKEQIRKRITEYFRAEGEQVFQSDLLEFVAAKEDCTQKAVREVLSELKKEKVVYNVRGMPGSIGLHS